MMFFQLMAARLHIGMTGRKPRAACPRCGFSWLAHEYPAIEWRADSYPCSVEDSICQESPGTHPAFYNSQVDLGVETGHRMPLSISRSRRAEPGINDVEDSHELTAEQVS